MENRSSESFISSWRTGNDLGVHNPTTGLVHKKRPGGLGPQRTTRITPSRLTTSTSPWWGCRR